ncbi:MAG: hypothetical protein LIP10_07465 [Clostridiales bacterium]|nr:hypothetical protein [Clostridiales bacterium]
MNRYMKPVILANDEISEGVYAASGCYSVSYSIHQKPETGRGDYRIQIDAVHDASHHSTAQVLVISFNQAVNYVSSNGTLSSGNGTSTLSINYSYHSNNTDNIGLGDVVVEADQGLAVTGAYMTCNETCSQHD